VLKKKEKRMLVWHGINTSTKTWYIKEKFKKNLICSNKVCTIYAQLSIPTSFACSSIRAIIRAVRHIDGLTVLVYSGRYHGVENLCIYVVTSNTCQEAVPAEKEISHIVAENIANCLQH